MNLPFSPTFFREIDIYQQLMEYESQKDKKHLWEGEKSVLIWAASEHHQHLGSAIGINHVKDALKYCSDKGYITEQERTNLYGSSRHIIESLPIHDFGINQRSQNPKNPSVKINKNGVLAGKILIKTRSLKKNISRYNFWIIIWWLVLAFAAIILLSQTLSAIRSIFGSGSEPNKTILYDQQYYWPKTKKLKHFYYK